MEDWHRGGSGHAAGMERPTYSLRAATPADEAFLFRLYQSTREEELSGWDPQLRAGFLTMQFAAQQRGHRGAYPAAERSIIELKGEPVGSFLAHRGNAQLRLVDLALLPEARGLGIGGSLVQELIQEAAAAGRVFALQVACTNRARNLYQRLGLRVIADDGVYASMERAP